MSPEAGTTEGVLSCGLDFTEAGGLLWANGLSSGIDPVTDLLDSSSSFPQSCQIERIKISLLSAFYRCGAFC